MSNKNINDLSLLTDTATGDYLVLWDTSAGLTNKVYVNDIINLEGTDDEWFTNIYVRNRGRISGVIGGNTGTNLLSGNFPGVLAGQSNRAVATSASVLGGESNISSGANSIVAGDTNTVFGPRSVVLGGVGHFSRPAGTVILGGDTNRIEGGGASDTAIIVGLTNVISGDANYSAIVAGTSNRLMADNAAIIAGNLNKASGDSAATVAGTSNVASGARSTVIGGTSSEAFGANAVVAGSNSSKALGNDSAVIGGASNIASGLDSCTLGGDSNQAFGARSCIAGGGSSFAKGADSFIGGGSVQKAEGDYSSVLGGANNVSSGQFSATLGQLCEAFPNGAVMFGDSTNVVKRAHGPNSITLNYSGGAWITGGGLNARRGFNLYPTGDAPTSSTAGRSGDFAYKDDYIYVFTGDNADLSNRNWGRIQLSTLNNTPPSIVSNDSSIVHGDSDPFEVTSVNSMENVTFGAGTPIISIPAGNNTFMIDCVFGICKGSTAAVATYTLWNDTDSRVIPNTSGRLTLLGTLTNPPVQQVHIRTITGTNYGAAKNIRLKVFKSEADAGGGNVIIGSTGTWISYVKLR